MSIKRISLALGAFAVFGLLAAGTVSAATLDTAPGEVAQVQQATPTGTVTVTPTGTPAPGATGNAGLMGEGSTPAALALGLVVLVGGVVGVSRWASARRSEF